MTLYQMMMWIPGAWRHNWLVTVMVSFVGTFGHMDIFMPEGWSKCYLIVLFIGVIGNFLCVRDHFDVSCRKISEEVQKDESGATIIKTYRHEKVWNAEKLMRLCMVLAAIIPCVLLLYYAYASDFQAQGRYVMPALLPVMYFVTLGYDCLLKKLVKNEKIRKICIMAAMAAVILSAVLVYFMVYAASY